MMSSTIEQDFSMRPSSLPTSPTGALSYPPASYDADVKSKRRSTSLTRVQDSFRRRSTSIQNKLQMKLLKMAELHLDIPNSGPTGLIFHVRDFPGDHTRESLAEVLNQSIDWLREHPGRGMSPFSSSSESSSPKRSPDLLDMEMASSTMPSLEPSALYNEQQRPLVTVDSFPYDMLTEQTIEEMTIEHLGTHPPAAPGILIDLKQSPSDTNIEQEIALSVGRDSTVDVRLHQDLVDIAPSFTSQLPASLRPGPQLMLLQQNPDTSTNFVSGKDGCTSATREIPKSLQPRYRDSPIHRKPVPNLTSLKLAATVPSAGPSTYLGVGLRPVVEPQPKPTLYIRPAPPPTATSSKEVLDRQRIVQAQQDHKSAQRRLSRKWNDRDLRGLCQSQTHLEAVEEQSVPKNTIGVSSVAEKISKFEKPLSALPIEPSTARNKKRLAIYGPPPPIQNVIQTWTSRQDLYQNVGTQQQPSPKPFGEFQPYRPPVTSPTRTTEAPKLPSVPHIKKGSMLKDIKKELFAHLEEIPCSTVITKSSSEQDKVRNDKAGVPPHKAFSPTQDYLKQESQLPYVAYSRTLVRKGTLKQLGGRVVDIRKQFEQDETHNTTMPSRQSTPQNGSKPTTKTSPYPPYDRSSPQTSLYAVIHPSHADRITANPAAFRSEMSQATQSRIQAAADEVDFAASWKKAVETGNDSDLIRKLDYAWEWKRFSDVEWNDKERARMPKGKGKKEERN